MIKRECDNHRCNNSGYFNRYILWSYDGPLYFCSKRCMKLYGKQRVK